MTTFETRGMELIDAMIDAKKEWLGMALNDASKMSSDDIKAIAILMKLIDMSLDYLSETNKVIAKIENIDDNMSKVLEILKRIDTDRKQC